MMICENVGRMVAEEDKEEIDAGPGSRRWLKVCGIAAGLLLIGFFWMIVERDLGERALTKSKNDLIASGELLTFAEFRQRLHTTNVVALNEYTNLLMSVGGVYSAPRRFWRSLTGRKFVWSKLTNWPAETGAGWVDDVWTVIPGSVEVNRGILERSVALATNELVLRRLPADAKNFRSFGRQVNGYLQLQGLAFIATLHDLREGRYVQALTNQLQALQLIRAARRDPSLLHFLRLDRIGVAAEGVWELLQYDEWTDAQLAELQSEWEAMELIQPMANEMRVGRVYKLDWWEKAHADPRQLHAYTSGGGGSLVSGLMHKIKKLFGGKGRVDEVVESARAIWWPMVTAQHDAAFFLKMSQTNIMALEAMDRARTPLAARGWCPTNVPATYLFSKWMSRDYRSWMTRIQRGETIKTLAVTAIAIKRHQLKHGKLPTDLSDLVPDYLRRDPVDWFDGKPLRFKPAPGGTFLLYSVGDNLTDGLGVGGNRSKFWGKDSDIVWPMPATDQETGDRRKELQKHKAKAAKP